MSLPILTKIKSENKFHYFVIASRAGSSFLERQVLLSEKNFYDINIWKQHELNPLPKFDIDKLHIEFYGRNPYRRLVSSFFYHWSNPTRFDLHDGVRIPNDIVGFTKEQKILKFRNFVETFYAMHKIYDYDRWRTKLAAGHFEIQHKILNGDLLCAGNHSCEDVGYIEPFNESVNSMKIKYKQIEDLENNFILKETWKSDKCPNFRDFVRRMKKLIKIK